MAEESKRDELLKTNQATIFHVFWRIIKQINKYYRKYNNLKIIFWEPKIEKSYFIISGDHLTIKIS